MPGVTDNPASEPAVLHPEETMHPLKRALRRLRMWVLLRFRHRFLHVGRNFYMGSGNHIRAHNVSIGDYSFIGSHCRIASQVRIGNWVMIASNVSMVGGDHRFRDVGTPAICAGRDENKPIIIEDDVWIGHGAIIMHGIRIGEGAVIAAGALVTRDVPPYAIVGSRPADIIGQRFDEQGRAQHAATLEDLRRQRGLVRLEQAAGAADATGAKTRSAQ